MTDKEEIPRTDICEECEREIVSNALYIGGKHELIHEAREADDKRMSATGGKVVIRFECRCESINVEYGPGSISVRNMPDAWMWEGLLSDTEQETQE